MFCIQCEQTLNNNKVKGCAFAAGMCGKTSEVSDLQDVLVYGLQAVSYWATKAREFNIIDDQIDAWVTQAFFATLTNVNFDPLRIQALSSQAQRYQTQLKTQVLQSDPLFDLSKLPKVALFTLPTSADQIVKIAPSVAVNRGKDDVNPDIIGLRLLCLYGLKGVAAYLSHAQLLDVQDADVYGRYHQIMAWLATDPDDINALLDCSLQIGLLNFDAMAMLDKGSTSYFGDPVPSQVNIRPRKGQCILVSGHDLKDLELILQQTANTGINVYTHGELLPAHSYPKLKQYPHLIGNYGSGWQNQQQEFANFPGAIVMTSNCLIDPNKGNYADRIFTRNIVGWPNVAHVDSEDFSAVIACAKGLQGFTQDEIEQHILIGFGKQSLLDAAPSVIEQVKAGNIQHFFLVGGCDGEKNSRSYYHDFAINAPQNSLILTLGCGKYRFNKEHLGDINGIPRLLDIGQCNDAYAAIMLALELAKAFECDVNALPLTLVLSWFEQKAIAILLTLFALGVKGIYAGPTAPAFLTDNLLAVIRQQFDLRLISDAKTDLDVILKTKHTRG